MKIMLDTNVLISALIFRGTPKQLIGQLLLIGHDIYISDYVENEFLDKIQSIIQRLHSYPQKLRGMGIQILTPLFELYSQMLMPYSLHFSIETSCPCCAETLYQCLAFSKLASTKTPSS